MLCSTGIAANLDALHALNEAIPDAQLSRPWTAWRKAGRSIAAAVEGARTKPGRSTVLPGTTCPMR